MRQLSWLRPARLRVEPLEGRTVPSTLTVLHLADGGPGSLRQAVLDANASPGADRIRFAPAARDGTITLTSGELPITDDLRIDGPGAGRLAVSGNGASRVFRIDLGVTAGIEGLTVTRGRFELRGGGIRNDGTLTLSHAVVLDNEVTGLPGFGTAVDAFGGGIFNTGTLTVRHTHFEGNRATGGDSTTALPGGAALGGAIMSLGSAAAPASATVSHCTFVDNQAVGGRASPVSPSTRNGLGGAIMNDAGTFDVSHSTFVGNRAVGGSSANTVGGGGSGGAVANVAFAGDATLSVRHSVLAGNQAVGGSGGSGGVTQVGRGGAIANFNAPFPSPTAVQASATVTNSVLVENQAVGGAGVIAGTGQGGGISNENGGTLTVARSILALNSAVGGASPGGTAGNGLGGGLYNGAPNPFGTPILTMRRSLVMLNRAEGGASSGGSDGHGIGGGVYVTAGGLAYADVATLIFANEASTSDDDVYGVLSLI